MVLSSADAAERRCSNCGAPMTRTAVSCDVCGMVAGSSAPLSSSGGSVQPSMTAPYPSAPYPSGGYPSGGYPSSGGSTPSSAFAPPGASDPSAPSAPGAPTQAPPSTYPPGYPAGYSAGYGAPGAYGPPPGYGQRTNSKAVTALVLGIVGLVVCQPVAIAAIVVAGQAEREIRFSGGVETGKEMATAGKILGWIGVAMLVIAVIAIVAMLVLGASVATWN